MDEVTLNIEGKKFECSKNALSENSEYFRAMFSSNMLERNATEITLNDVSADGFKLILDYISTGNLNLTNSNVFIIVPVVCMLQFTQLKTYSCDYMLRSISYSNCFSVFYICDKFCLSEMYEKAKAFIFWHFHEILNTDEFMMLPKATLKWYLSSDELNVNSEYDVFEALMNWISFNFEKRKNDLCELKSCIRFNLIPNAEFQEKVLLHRNLKDNSLKQNLMDYCIQQKTNSHQKRQVPETLLLVIEDVSDLSLKFANLDSGKVKRLEQLPSDFVYCLGMKAYIIGKYLYLTGGERKLGKNGWMMDVWCYDLIFMTWKVVTKLTQPRRNHTICSHGDYLYLIGGFGRHRLILDSAERFNIKTGIWENLPDLKECVFSAVAAVSDDTIFVVKTHFQCFDTCNNEWTMKPSPVTFDSGLQSATTFNNHIYLLGQYSAILWRYNPATHTIEELVRFPHPGVGCIKSSRFYLINSEMDDTSQPDNDISSDVQVYNLLSSKMERSVSLPISSNCKYLSSLVAVQYT
ncbi:ectoderm-neural cortex protein 1-like [Tubulanus polymorphus]|uniref:ectoderm-neural cortex protein 1-like n=1 Tax=Tubulanus polymorphus TaxID=672921 RepID=UPI003DA4040C